MKWKFPDEEGVIVINGVDVKWRFKNDHFSKKPVELGCPHLEFDSGKVANAISETGYRSYFFGGVELEGYDTILDFIKAYVKFCINENGDKKMDKIKTTEKTLECWC